MLQLKQQVPVSRGKHPRHTAGSPSALGWGKIAPWRRALLPLATKGDRQPSWGASGPAAGTVHEAAGTKG